MPRPKKVQKPTFGSIETRAYKTITTYRAVWLRDGYKQHKNFDTYEDALDFLNEVGAEVRQGVKPRDMKKPATPFRLYAERWYGGRPGAKHWPLERDSKATPHSKSHYVKGEPVTPEAAEFAASRKRERSALQELFRAFGEMPIGYITRQDIQGWVNESDLSATTIHSYYGTLGHILRDAQLDGYMPNGVPIGRRLISLPPKTRRMVFLDDEEMDHLLAVALEVKPSQYAMIHVAAHTGLRLGELLALRRVNYKRPQVGRKYLWVEESLKEGHLGTVKTREPRRVGLQLCCVEALDAHLAGHESLMVFPAPGGGLQSRDNFRNHHWVPIRDAVVRGFDERKAELHFHDLRHSHCSSLLAGGWDVVDVARRMGHRSAKMTLDIYGHPHDGREDRLLEERGIRAS